MTLQLLQPEIIKANGAILAKYIGGAIEQVSPTAFKGHGIRWHKNRPDLQGEHFSPKTYLMRNAGYPVKGIPANYQHGLHKDFGNLAIGMIRFADEDEFGLFIEGELKTREEYIEMLKEIGRKADVKFTDNQLASKSALMVKEVDMLVSKVPMQFSGGFDPSTWIVDPDTKHIDQAGMIHLAFTPTPADDLNPMVRFKSALQEVLKYEPSTVYSLPNQQTDSPTGRKGGTDHKGDNGASADNEAAQPNAQPTTDNKIPPKTGAKKKMAKKKKNNRFSHIRQEFEEQVGEVASEVFEELAEVVEDIAQEFGISLDPAEVEDIAETVEEEIVSEIEDVEEAPVMMMDDEEDEDEQKHKKSLDVNKLRQMAYFKAYAKIGALQQKRSQQKDSARQAARNKWQQQQPATSHLPAYTGGGNGYGEDNTPYRSKVFKGIPNIDSGFARRVDKTPLLMHVKSQMRDYQDDDDVRKYRVAVREANKASALIGANLDYLSTPEIREDLIAELLPKTFLDKVGATITTVPGNQTVERPKLTKSPKGVWLGENDEVPEDTFTAEMLMATPKPVAGFYQLPIAGLERMDGNTESMLRNQLLSRIALAINEAAESGTGNVNTGTTHAGTGSTGAQPLGLLNALPSSQIVNLSANGRAPTPKDMSDIKSAVEARDIELGSSTHWVYHSNVLNYFEDLTDTTGQLINRAQWTKGYEPVTSNVIPTNLSVGTGTNLTRILFGDWQYFEVVQSNAMQLRVFDDSRFTMKLQVGVMAWTFVDFLIHYTEAFEVRTAVKV